MIIRKIYEQLGWDAKYEDEVKNFNSRIVLVIDKFESELRSSNKYDYIYPDLIKEFAFLLGESKYSGISSIGYHYYFSLTIFFHKEGGEKALSINIKNYLLLLEALKKILPLYYSECYKFLLNEIKRIFDISPIEIGYSFTEETIIKKGAKELDEKLISDNLTWLVHYPNIKQQYENALKYYLTKDDKDALTNAYSSLESLVKTYLNTEKQFDNNEIRIELIRKLGLGEEWGQLLYFYSKLAHEFSSRHGQKDKGNKIELSSELIEFYIYITGVFIRLIIQVIKKDRNLQ